MIFTGAESWTEGEIYTKGVSDGQNEGGGVGGAMKITQNAGIPKPVVTAKTKGVNSMSTRLPALEDVQALKEDQIILCPLSSLTMPQVIFFPFFIRHFTNQQT